MCGPWLCFIFCYLCGPWLWFTVSKCSRGLMLAPLSPLCSLECVELSLWNSSMVLLEQCEKFSQLIGAFWLWVLTPSSPVLHLLTVFEGCLKLSNSWKAVFFTEYTSIIILFINVTFRIYFNYYFIYYCPLQNLLHLFYFIYVPSGISFNYYFIY